MKACFFAGLCFFLLTGPAGAQPAYLAAIQKANQDYLKGEYAQAAAGYEEVVAQGIINGNLRYNLGNAYLQQGKLGPATFNYLKALRLLPRSEDIRANLALAQRQTQDLLEWRQPHPAGEVLFWLEEFTLAEHITALTLLNLLFWAGLGVRLFRRNPWTGRMAHLLLGLFIAGMVSTGARWHLESNWNWAVVAAKTVDLMPGRGFSNDPLLQLHEGAIVTVLSEKGQWMELQLPDGRQGWAVREALLT
ncbi:MAG: hypothetical protein ACE5ER_04435 [Nitrospinaceae bacterium]